MTSPKARRTARSSSSPSPPDPIEIDVEDDIFEPLYETLWARYVHPDVEYLVQDPRPTKKAMDLAQALADEIASTYHRLCRLHRRADLRAGEGVDEGG